MSACLMLSPDACAQRRFSASRDQQPGQSGGVVGGHREDEARAHALDAEIHGLCHAAYGLRPVEGLLDLLVMLLGQGIARMTGGSAVDCRIPRFQGAKRGDTGFSQISDKLGRVKSLVGTECQLSGRSGGCRRIMFSAAQRLRASSAVLSESSDVALRMLARSRLRP